MPSKEAEFLRQQVLRSQRIATIKRNIEILSSNVNRLRGEDTKEELLPAREEAIVAQNSKIAALRAELRELELKQKIQKSLMERSKKAEEKEKDHREKPGADNVPVAEKHPKAEETAGHANETISKEINLNRAKERDTLEEQHETGPGAELAQKKRMAELEAEVRVLSDMIERITEEMLKSEDVGKGPGQASHAEKVPTTEFPSGVEKAESQANAKDMAAKKRILERLQHTLTSAQATPVQPAENVDLKATARAHDGKAEVEQITVERPKEAEKSEDNNQEKQPSDKSPAASAPLEVDNAVSRAEGTAPEKSIPETLQQNPDSAQAKSHHVGENVGPLTKTHEHDHKEQDKEITVEGTKEEEKIECNTEEKRAGSVPTADAPPKVADTVVYTRDTAPEEKTPEHLQLDPDATEAMATQISKKADLPAEIYEPKGEIAKMTGEGTKADEKTEGNDQEKMPPSKVPTTETPWDAERDVPHASNTSPEAKVHEPHPNPQSGQAMGGQASKNDVLLAKIQELEQKLQAEREKKEKTKAAEDARLKIEWERKARLRAAADVERIFGQRQPPPRDPQSETSSEVQMPVRHTRQIAEKKKPLKQPPPSSANAQALAEFESKIGDIKAQIHQRELNRRKEKTAEGTKAAVIKTEQTRTEGSKLKVAMSTVAKSEDHKADGTKPDGAKHKGAKPEGTESAGTKLKEVKPEKTRARETKPQRARVDGTKSAQTGPGGAKPARDRPEGTSVENMGKDLSKPSGATAPAYITPLQMDRPMSHTHEMAPRKKKPENFLPNAASAQAIPADGGKIRSFKAKLDEHELKEKIRKQRAELRAKALASKISDNSGKIPAESASAGDTLLGVTEATSRPDETLPKKRKPDEDPEVIPDSAKKRICTHEPKDSPGDTEPMPTEDNSTSQTLPEAEKAIPHTTETSPKKRKVEEDPETFPGIVKKQRYSPNPKARGVIPGKRKRSESAEPGVQDSGIISTTEHDEDVAEDTELTQTENDSSQTAPEAIKAVQHASETTPKQRKAEEDPEAVPGSAKKQRYSPKSKDQGETPQKRRLTGSEGSGIESPEYISIAEFAEQDAEDTGVGDGEEGNTEAENVPGEGVPDVPQGPVEEGPVPGNWTSGRILYNPPPAEPMYMYDPWVDEVDYEID